MTVTELLNTFRFLESDLADAVQVDDIERVHKLDRALTKAWQDIIESEHIDDDEVELLVGFLCKNLTGSDELSIGEVEIKDKLIRMILGRSPGTDETN